MFSGVAMAREARIDFVVKRDARPAWRRPGDTPCNRADAAKYSHQRRTWNLVAGDVDHHAAGRQVTDARGEWSVTVYRNFCVQEKAVTLFLPVSLIVILRHRSRVPFYPARPK